MDRFSELRAFIAVVEAGGFSAAARQLGQSRSAVNRHVLSLEQRLGAQLLNRTTRDVSPTSDGLAFVERARQILGDLDDAEAAVGAVRREAIGLIRVSGPVREDPVDLSGAVCAFLAQNPRVQIELNLETRIVDPIAEGFDVVVRVGEPDEETSFVDHRLARFEYIVCASPDHLDAHGEPNAPDELRRRPLLNFSGDRSIRSWRFIGPNGDVQIPVAGPLCSNAIAPVRMAAVQGVGIAVLPSFAVANDIERGALRRILVEHKLPERILQVIYPPSRHLSAKVRMFVDHLIDWFDDARM